MAESLQVLPLDGELSVVTARRHARNLAKHSHSPGMIRFASRRRYSKSRAWCSSPRATAVLSFSWIRRRNHKAC